ncbi:MAG: ABC transporter permease [Lacunisphaera sp.]
MYNLRQSIRSLLKTPGFTATALATLAICIGANVTILAVVDAILLRPLPFHDAERLVTMYNSYPKAGKDRDEATLTNYYERRGNIPAFSSMAALREFVALVGEVGAAQREDVAHVSPEFFATLGVPLAKGRTFTEAELTFANDRVVILSDAYWRQHFHADPNVLGREIRMDDTPVTIVGVLPAGFRFLSSRATLFRPLSSSPWEHAINQRYNTIGYTLIARLKPGVTVAEAQAEVTAHDDAHAAEFPDPKTVVAMGHRTVVAPLRSDHVASIRPTLLLLQAGALLLLVIGAVNLVNLFLIRASTRAKELAIRQSLGAGRRHIVWQVLAETLLLTTVGGLGGLVIGAWGVSLVSALGAAQLPLGATIEFDQRVALIALLGSVGLGTMISIPVACFSLRRHLSLALRSESRTDTGSRAAQRVRHGFIVTQIAVAFVLLTGAGLLSVSLQRAMAVSPGFRSDHVLTGEISLPWKRYPDIDADIGFTDRLLTALAQQPGVTAAGVTNNLPVHPDTSNNFILSVPGYTPQAGEAPLTHHVVGVTGDYFTAMGIQLIAGRFLDASDSHRDLRVCVVDAIFARHYWGEGNALGRRVFQYAGNQNEGNAFTVVGVVGAVKHDDLTETGATGAIYYPYRHYATGDNFVVARTTLTAEMFATTLRQIVKQIDPELFLDDLRTMDQRIADSLIARRSPALLAGIFAAVALLLAAIGTYGVLAYAVSQRRREIGVRMALGALPRQVLKQFLSLGARLLLSGLVLGVVGAWAVGRAMQSILFGVGAVDASVLVTTGVTMIVVVLLAIFIPARRATKVDPVVALRAE